MSKMILLKALSGLCILGIFSANANCLISEQEKRLRDAKYADHISIVPSLVEDTYSVLITPSQEINGHTLQSIMLVLGDTDTPDLTIALDLFVEDGIEKAGYFVKAKQAKQHTVYISYGENCGIEVQKSVNFNAQP
ncbi:hypothetical protein [Thalassotalea aquiviva]|uniref:hypothetical protein n=1 Tax=Thalassotalea aquiviva TaxID=3242415 RepID=UPI00352A7832